MKNFKRVAVMALLLGWSVVAFAQQGKDSIAERVIFQVVEQEPQFPGGEEAKTKFLEKHIVYPKEALEASIEGTVLIGFVIEPDGSLTNFKVLWGADPLLDAEALRVAKLMPNWIPGKQRGKSVSVQFQMLIPFSLHK